MSDAPNSAGDQDSSVQGASTYHGESIHGKAGSTQGHGVGSFGCKAKTVKGDLPKMNWREETSQHVVYAGENKGFETIWLVWTVKHN